MTAPQHQQGLQITTSSQQLSSPLTQKEQHHFGILTINSYRRRLFANAFLSFGMKADFESLGKWWEIGKAQGILSGIHFSFHS